MQRKPFTSFNVTLASGERISVKHQEHVYFSESETTIIVVEGEHIRIFDVANISSIRLPKKAGTSHNGAKS